MSSLIEQAALRLEQLRNAGAHIPAAAPNAIAAAAGPRASRRAAVAEPARVRRHVGTSRMVEIDLEALSQTHIVSTNEYRSVIADQFRVIKRPLIANAVGKGPTLIPNGNLIMVTSALQDEGKSFTALNLAMSIATELDYTVMLVDADVARPSVLAKLKLAPSPGLLDLVLSGSLDVSSVLLKTNIDKLTLLPSGTPHPRATELLASDAMTRLLEDIGSRYSDRIVIFDSPPLLLTTESRVLAAHMGQIVFVVKSGSTLQSDVQNALTTIEDCPMKFLLLNQATTPFKEGYSFSYGYGNEDPLPRR